MKYCVMSGAGNAFAVVDAERERLALEPQDLARLARAMCATGAPGEPAAAAGRAGLDGLLVVAPPAQGGHRRMLLYNADGSRPEACGNGLRCVARFAREEDYAPQDGVLVETDAGLRSVQLLRERGSIVGARASMGLPRILAEQVELTTALGAVSATLVDMGNPHCVLFVDDERTAPVSALGALLERHPRFPQRTNVEFATAREGALWVRVWERGVGETAACGTGACAAAVAAAALGRADLPVDVVLPGGRLRVAWTPGGEAELTGPCERIAERRWPERG